jgi:WD40 repeat protein
MPYHTPLYAAVQEVSLARVFISYARDLSRAEGVAAWLLGEGHQVFLDRSAEHGIAPGDGWELRLYERLRWADAVLCIVSAAYATSAWCSAELGSARSLGCRLLPLRIDPDVNHPLLVGVQVVDYDNDWQRRIGSALRGIDASGGTGWDEGRNPFPGLEPFDTNMHKVFFGRETEVNELTGILRSRSEPAGQMILVVGPSGCGKSSLLRAGLAPRLAATPGWLTLPAFVPHEEPVRLLAAALTGASRHCGLGWTVTSVADRLKTERGFAETVEDLLVAALGSSQRQLLVVVDQVEELLKQVETARADFARVLASVTSDQVRLVGSIRPEFLAPLLADTAFAPVRVRPFAVRPLPRDSLRLVIRGPAQLAGIGIDEKLTARLVADTRDGEALPLLAFTLSELAANAVRGSHFSASRYDEIGGVRGSVPGRANEALAEAMKATGRSKDDVITGLLQLVAVDDEGRPTRRRIARMELPDEVNVELDHFVARRLLVVDAVDDEARLPVISVAHEAFLSEWAPLAEAIEANAKTLRDCHLVERLAAEWAATEPDGTQLLRGGRLGAARQLLEDGRLTEVGRRFVEESLTAHRKAIESARRRRWLRAAAALVVVGVVGASTAAISITTAQENEQALRDATRQLFADAQVNTVSRPEAALRWGITAAAFVDDIDDTQLKTEAHDSLVSTLASTRYLGRIPIDNDVVQFVAGPGSRFLTVNREHKVELRDDATDQPNSGVLLPDVAGQVDQAFFGPVKDRLTTLASNGPLTVWDITDWSHPTVIGTAPMEANPITAVAMSQDGSRMFTGDSKGIVSAWNLADPVHPVKTGSAQSTTRDDVLEYTSQGWSISGPRPEVVALAVRPDNTLVSTTLDTLTWWTVSSQTPSPIRTTDLPSLAQAFPDASDFNHSSVPTRDDAKMTARLAPDGNTVLVGGGTLNNAAAMLVNTDAAVEILAPLSGHAHAVISAAFSADGRYLATVGSDYAVRLWAVRDRRHPVLVDTFSNDVGVPIGVEFSLGGGVLYVALSDGSVDSYATEGVAVERSRQHLQEGERPVLALPIEEGLPRLITDNGGSQAPRSVATADPMRHLVAIGTRTTRQGIFAPSDATVQIRDTKTDDLEVLATIPDLDNVTALTLSESGHLLAVGTERGSTFLYRIDDPRKPEKLSGVFAIHGISFSINPLGLPTTEIAQLAFHPNGRWLAIGTVGAGIFLYDISDNSRMVFLTRLTEPAGAVHALGFSPDGTALGAGSDDGVIRIWDTRNTTPAAPSSVPSTTNISTTASPPEPAPTTSGAASVASTTNIPTTSSAPELAPTTSATSSVPTTTTTDRPPDSPTINPLPLTVALQSPDGGVLALAYDGDSELLATGTSLGAVTLWDSTDARHPKKLQTFQGPTGGVTTLDFAFSGTQLLATDGTQNVITWSTKGAKNIVASPVAVACRIVHQGLTAQEWAEHLPRYKYRQLC